MVASGRTQVVVITGASAGVGRATAIAFARRGARLALLARGEAGLASAARDVEAAGGRALAIPTDVSDPDQVERAAAMVEDRFGPIDVWINNAMVSVFSPVHKMTPEEFKRVADVTYLGAVYGTLSALKRMRPRNRGTIVQVGSALAYRGIPLQSAYCAAKHALQGFTESLRTELMHDRCKIRLTMVQLPGLNTPQFRWTKSRMPNKAQPVPPIYQPEVAARAILWASQNNRRELFVGFPALLAIWGNKIVPWYADRVLAKSGYKNQQVNEPEDPNRPHNLWKPVSGQHQTHGVFDHRAHSWSPQLWATTNRGLLAGILAAAAGLALAALVIAPEPRKQHARIPPPRRRGPARERSGW